MSRDSVALEQVWLEPWGEWFELEGDHVWLFDFQSPIEGCPELVLTSEGPVLWGWAGCRLRVFRDGELLDNHFLLYPPVPERPAPPRLPSPAATR